MSFSGKKLSVDSFWDLKEEDLAETQSRALDAQINKQFSTKASQ